MSSSKPAVKITYFVEMMSSWCFWAEPTWLELKKRYDSHVAFDWKIALMNPSDFPVSAAHCDWFYRRSGTVMRSPIKLNSGWVEPELGGNYTAPNLVAEAGRSLGFSDDRLRLSLMHAAMKEGRKIGRMTEAVRVAAEATGLAHDRIRSLAETPEVMQRIQATTSEFHGMKINQRPAFLIEDAIGDRALFSGIVTLEPLTATIDAMLSDTAAYQSYAAHHGPPPTS